MSHDITATAPLDQQLAPLAARLAAIQAQKADLEQTEKALKQAILALTPGPDTYQAGDISVVVSQARVIDKKAVETKYPADKHPELYSLVPDTTKIRQHIAPVDLEALQTTSAPSVKLQ